MNIENKIITLSIVCLIIIMSLCIYEFLTKFRLFLIIVSWQLSVWFIQVIVLNKLEELRQFSPKEKKWKKKNKLLQ